MTAVADLPERKTLNGKFDAYCHVCWQAIYCLWVDDVDPAGACIEGATRIGDCKQASSWERTKGEILAYLQKQRASAFTPALCTPTENKG